MLKESEFKIVKKISEVDKLVQYCKKTGYASIDFETKAKGPKGVAFGSGRNKKPTGFPYEEDEPTVIGISFQIGGAWVIPLYHDDSPFSEKEVDEIWNKLRVGILEDEKIVKIAQNMKFEDTWLRRYGIRMKGRLFDTMLAKYLLNEERPHGLKEMIAHYFEEFAGYEDEIEKLVALHRGWEYIPLEPLCKYNAMDCDYTLRVYIELEKRLIKNDLYPLYRNLLMMAHRVLSESEEEGMLINKEYLLRIIKEQGEEIEKNNKKLLKHKKVKAYAQWRLKKHIKNMIKAVKKEIKTIRKDETKDDSQKARLIKSREEKISRYVAGELVTKKEILGEVNFNSPDQMSELLFTSKGGFGFEVFKETDSGNPSTDEESLLALNKEDDSGFIDKLLKHRELTKLYSTYMIGIENRLNCQNRVHGKFLLHGTVTGRLSSREPNLQNIPRDTTSSLIKPMFIAPPGYTILQLDYSQAELRVMAEMAGEKEMIKWFKEGRDIHLATACKKMDWDYDERKAMLDDEDHKKHKEVKVERKKAKTTNFGIAYEQGPGKLADKMTEQGVPTTMEEAKEILSDWFSTFPKVKKYIKNQHKKVYDDGEVRTLFGRRRRFGDEVHTWQEWEQREAERQATNSPVQGTASDFALFSSVLIREAKLRGELPWDMTQIYTVHDSLGYYIRGSKIHEVVPIMERICRNPDTMKWFGFEMKKVKMDVDFEVGDDWGHLKGYSKDIKY